MKIKSYEMIKNVKENSVVEHNGSIFINKGFSGLGYKLELLDNKNEGKYIGSCDYVAIVKKEE